MVERSARLFKLVREDERVLMAIVSDPDVVFDVVRSVVVDHLREILDERNLAGRIHSSQVERPILGLLLVCECSDDRVPSKQCDEAEQQDEQASDIGDTTNSEDRPGLSVSRAA